MLVSGVVNGGSLDFGETVLTFPSTQRRFLAAFDAQGDLLWARDGGEPPYPGFDYRDASCAGSGGDLYQTARIFGTLDLGGGIVVTDTSGSEYGTRYVAHYAADGTALDVRTIPGDSTALDCVVDDQGNVVLTGDAQEVDFGAVAYQRPKGSGRFAVGFAPDGTHRWSWIDEGSGGSYTWTPGLPETPVGMVMALQPNAEVIRIGDEEFGDPTDLTLLFVDPDDGSIQKSLVIPTGWGGSFFPGPAIDGDPVIAFYSWGDAFGSAEHSPGVANAVRIAMP